MLAGDLAEARQEGRRRDDVAALAEDRLDDDRRHPVRVDDLVEEQVELRLPVARAGGIGLVAATGGPVAVGNGRVVDAARQRLEGRRGRRPSRVVSAIVWAVRPWKPPRKR